MIRLAVAAIVAALVLPGVASAWSSNTWQSPTGNIICRYAPGLGAVVTCATRDTNRIAYVTSTGAGQLNLGEIGALADAYGPILQYGQKWEPPSASFECLSTITSMRCVNRHGQGFWISRAGVQIVGRRATDLPGLG